MNVLHSQLTKLIEDIKKVSMKTAQKLSLVNRVSYVFPISVIIGFGIARKSCDIS